MSAGRGSSVSTRCISILRRRPMRSSSPSRAPTLRSCSRRIYFIVEEGLWDAEFVDSYTNDPGLKRLAAHVRGANRQGIPYTPEWAEGISGVPATATRSLAVEYATTKHAGIVSGARPEGREGQRFADDARPSASCAPSPVTSTGVGCDVFTPQSPDRDPNSHRSTRVVPGFSPAHPTKMFHVPPYNHPDSSWPLLFGGQGLIPTPDMYRLMREGKLKVAVIQGANIMVTQPQPDVTRVAMANVDFICVIDPYLSETAELADLVLPGRRPTRAHGARMVQVGRLAPHRDLTAEMRDGRRGAAGHADHDQARPRPRLRRGVPDGGNRLLHRRGSRAVRHHRRPAAREPAWDFLRIDRVREVQEGGFQGSWRQGQHLQRGARGKRLRSPAELDRALGSPVRGPTSQANTRAFSSRAEVAPCTFTSSAAPSPGFARCSPSPTCGSTAPGLVSWNRERRSRRGVEPTRLDTRQSRADPIIKRGWLYVPGGWRDANYNVMGIDDELDPISSQANYTMCAGRVDKITSRKGAR